MRSKVLGAVIAGGRSRRFGGDKAQALLDGRPLLDHVIEGLMPQVGTLLICGRQMPGVACLPDRPRPDLGPLGGLAAALHHASCNGFVGVLTSACDTPHVPRDLSERLVGSDPAVLVSQPLFGFWPATLSVEIGEYLAAGESCAVRDWVTWAGARQVMYGSVIVNINTPADLTALQFRRFLAA